MALDVAAARRSLEPIAARLGFSIEHSANGLLGIVTANMVRAIRTVSVERGHDPRDFCLMPFGGAGALHADRVARELDIGEILVPAAPGILCAMGLVVSDLKEDFVRSARMAVADENRARMQTLITELLADAGAWQASEDVAEEDTELALSLDMRYVGQNFELAVAIEGATTTDLPNAAYLRELLGAAHEMNYGYSNPNDPVEVMNFRLTARARLEIPRAIGGGGQRCS